MSKKKIDLKHLTQEARSLFQEISREYEIEDPAGQHILRVAVEAFDRAQAARAQIELDGMTITGRDGQVKVHPLCSVERDARHSFLSGLKQLRLDLEPVGQVGRPPGR